jgi:hypothetical protein
VLGFYRSHTLPDFELCREDEDLMRAQFAAAEDLVLLVKPSLMGTSESDFCIRRCGRAAAQPAPPPPSMAWPAPRPRQSRREPEPEPAVHGRSWRWTWYIAAILLGLAGGAFGYLWWHPDAGIERLAASAPAPPSARPVEGTPAPPEPDIPGIHDLVNRWASALKRGDVEAAALCYAPVVSTYFARHDVTRDAVRQSIRQSAARYAHLDVFRVSGLAVTPVSDSRAVATFRKHWQTSGRRRTAGDEEERMTLVRTESAWRISSEQAEAR